MAKSPKLTLKRRMNDQPQVFEKLPTTRPSTPLLDTINQPTDLRCLGQDALNQLAHELRHFLLYTVGQTGGHFGAGLGAVELTIALHKVFNTPVDRLIWDVGHQTYPHKILTGRREKMHLLRKPGGPAPFPSRAESEYDAFGTGHSSTSISAALGMQLASSLTSSGPGRTLLVIGDGAMTAGMAFEALNHAAACQTDLLVILNDNAMSISENVGGLANYFARNISARDTSEDVSEGSAAPPGSIFADLGFNYSGPVDGHDLASLIKVLESIGDQEGPRLLHVITQKGKGYGPAEASPVDSHSLTKLEKKNRNQAPSCAASFGKWICEKAASDPRLFAITPAMREGSGLGDFAKHFPDRFHDVAIAEQHALAFAAGLAASGAKPVVAIYSTFLQRAYDQLIHDIAIQNLDVLLAVDRASLLEDGPTHSGVFDHSFARIIPNLTLLAPATDWQLTAMLNFGYEFEGPCLVRYPRGTLVAGKAESPIVHGKGDVCTSGSRVALLTFGAVREIALEVAASENYTVADMRFIKPLDEGLIAQLADSHELLVSIEESASAGGAGSAIGECLHRKGSNAQLLTIGVPDRFIESDEPVKMREEAGLSARKVRQAIARRLKP